MPSAFKERGISKFYGPTVKEAFRPFRLWEKFKYALQLEGLALWLLGEQRVNIVLISALKLNYHSREEISDLVCSGTLDTIGGK